VKDLLIGFGYPVVILLGGLVAASVSTAVIAHLAFHGKDMAIMQMETERAHRNAAERAEENDIIHGQTFAPVR
jgi:hypothetical protein